MLSRHFRAHNLNVSEMRLLYSLRCADPGIFVRGEEGGGGGGRPDCRKTTATTLFLIFNPQQILQFYRGGEGPVFFRGSNFFQGGQDAYFHKNAYNL